MADMTGQALLLDAAQAAALCSLSKATWHRLDALGRIPAPITLCRRKLWSRAELNAWVLAGCPIRPKWEKLKKNMDIDLLYGRFHEGMYMQSNRLHGRKAGKGG